MRRSGTLHNRRRSQELPEMRQFGRTKHRICNSLVVSRVVMLLLGLACAWKYLPQSPFPTPHYEHRVVFFKLYSGDMYQNCFNVTQTLGGNTLVPASVRTRHLTEYGLCPRCRVFGGFSHTHWNREYYVKMRVGKSKKLFHFLIDTGSQPSWLHCKWPAIEKHPVAGPNGMYVPEKEVQVDCRSPECLSLQRIPSNFNNIRNLFPCNEPNDWRCTYDITYLDRSHLRGFYVQDVVSLATLEGEQLDAKITLGCSWHASSDRYGEEELERSPLTTDGLLGLNKGTESFVSQLKRQGAISSHVVGHCFRSLDTTDFETNSGFMFFGKSKLLDSLPITWSPMASPTSDGIAEYLYKVYVKKIKLGELSLEMTDKSNIIIDSGSTTTHILDSIYNPIRDEVAKQALLKGYVSFQGTVPDSYYNQLKHCWCIPTGGAPDRDFEMLHIQLQESRSGHDPEKGKDYPRQTKASLDLKPEQYLMWKDCSVDGCDLLCFSVEPEQQQQPEGEAAHQVATIGGFALQGFLVVMDAEQDQFGWARSSCDDEEYKFHYSF
ncbi:aspartic proteinase Asp1-like [Physcomitrium patens]|uniref:aspartic proteinase Asp1-like n=1 Tax=Physcomitrium patens TaxID=3218 RepID=UPI003CCCD3EF